jgi:hypothetical protein
MSHLTRRSLTEANVRPGFPGPSLIDSHSENAKRHAIRFELINKCVSVCLDPFGNQHTRTCHANTKDTPLRTEQACS